MRNVIAVAGLFGLAACNQPAGTKQSSPGGGPRATTSAGVPQVADACALLDKATVGAALGMEIVTAQAGTATTMTKDAAGVSTCFYELADGQRLAFLSRQSPTPDNTPAAMKKARDEVSATLGTPVAEVTGVGRSAFWVPGLRQLVVFLGEDRYFNITMPAELGGKDPKTLALGLATKVE